MKALEFFDVDYSTPILTNPDFIGVNLNEVHHFKSKIQVDVVLPNGHLGTTYKTIELWEISPGIFVSPDRLDTGAAPHADGTQIDFKYYHKDRLTTTYLQQSIDLQRSNYLEGLKKIFLYYKNNFSTSKNLKNLIKTLQFQPICGFRRPTDYYFDHIYDPANSVEVFADTIGGLQRIGAKRANLVIIPPTSREPINEACALQGIGSNIMGSGSYAIIKFDPFIATRMPQHFPQASFIVDPALCLLHEILHATRIHRGICIARNENGVEPKWGSAKHGITGLTGRLEQSTRIEEILTFNKKSIGVTNTLASALQYRYMMKMYDGTWNSFSDLNGVVGVYDRISNFLEQYDRRPLSQNFIKYIKKCYDIKYDRSKERFIIDRLQFEKYVTGAFGIDEVSLAKKLAIETRPYYNVSGGSSSDDWTYYINILDDRFFSSGKKRALSSQRFQDHTPLPNSSVNPATINFSIYGSDRVTLPNTASVYLPTDDESTVPEGIAISEDTEITTSGMKVSGTIESQIYDYTVIDDSLPKNFVGTDEYPKPDGNVPKGDTSIPINVDAEVTVTNPTAPMINAIMKLDRSKEFTSRPVLNQDLEATLKTQNETYVPKIAAMNKLDNGVNYALGAVGYGIWAGQLVNDISDAIRVKKINYGKMADDFMSIIPFYCAYKNLEEGEYELSSVNAELDAFSIFSTDGTAFIGLSTAIASMTINWMVPKLETVEAYRIMFDKYLDKYLNDINDFTFNYYLQWEFNISDRLWNESNIAVQGFTNMLETTKTVMEYDAINNNFSAEDKVKVKQINEETFNKFPDLIQTFAKNSMRTSIENAGEIFFHNMWLEIGKNLDEYTKASKSYFLDFLEDSYTNKGLIGITMYERYKEKASQVFINNQQKTKLILAVSSKIKRTLYMIERTSTIYNVMTDFKGNAIHIDSLNTATKDIKDLYGNYSVLADQNTVSVKPARFNRVLKITKNTSVLNTVALNISANDGKKHELEKGLRYTISFWLRMPVPQSPEERRVFSYSAYDNNREIEELVLQVKNNKFVLSTQNRWTNNDIVISNLIALNRWVKVTIVHYNTAVELWVDDKIEGTIHGSSRKLAITISGALKFYNYNVDYQVDEISYYPSYTSNAAIKEDFMNHSEFMQDYWGERLEYNKYYYLLADDNKSGFNHEQGVYGLKLRKVPDITTKFLGVETRLNGYYGGLQFKLVPVSRNNPSKFVRPTDKFILTSKEYVGSLAIVARGQYNVERFLQIVRPEDGYDAEVFTFDSEIKLNKSQILIGTGKNAWGESMDYARGTSDELWLNGAHMNGHVTSVDKSEYSNDEIEKKFKWIFVPKDPNWTE